MKISSPASNLPIEIVTEKYPTKLARTLLLIASIVLGATMTLNLIGEEGTDGSFRDDLLDRLVGKWEATGIVHGRPSKSKIELSGCSTTSFSASTN